MPFPIRKSGAFRLTPESGRMRDRQDEVEAADWRIVLGVTVGRGETRLFFWKVRPDDGCRDRAEAQRAGRKRIAYRRPGVRGGGR